MARTVRYHPLFDSDVLNAADWYDERSPDLGADFVDRVRSSVERLVADPERRSKKEFGLRYWPVERFPYVVFYDLTELEVLVIGLMHTSQDAHKWFAERG